MHLSSGSVESLFVEYADDVYNFLVYYTGRRDVEDIVQETFVKAIKGLERTSNIVNPRSWLFMIARNTAMDHARRAKREVLVSDAAFANIPYDGPSPDESAACSEYAGHIVNTIQKLKREYRDVLVLRLIMQQSGMDVFANS